MQRRRGNQLAVDFSLGTRDPSRLCRAVHQWVDSVPALVHVTN
jgi:hypothetical protein